MAKTDLVEFDGVVIDAMPNAIFKVQLDNGHILMANINGKMRKNNIRVLVGDRVSVEVSVYDVEKGRIKFRYK